MGLCCYRAACLPGAAGALAACRLHLQHWQNTLCRLQAVGVDNSAKLSAFLALGCLSPRMVHAEVMRLAAADEQQARRLPAAAAEAQPAQRLPAAGAEAQQAQQQAAAAAQWREPHKGDTWRWLLMHQAIRDFFIYSALREGEGDWF